MASSPYLKFLARLHNVRPGKARRPVSLGRTAYHARQLLASAGRGDRIKYHCLPNTVDPRERKGT